ncbi:beta-ketoacyl-ACP synthase III [Chloroflexota bacterium]
MQKYARVTGWGKYLPENVVTNKDLEEKVNTSDLWIQARTGIRERRIAADDETASGMAVKASQNALSVAGLKPEQIDLVIVATVTPEMIFPSCASLVQHAIGAKNAAAFDLNAACTGFVYAIATASQFIGTGTYKKILVVGSEVYSRILDWGDRGTCVLFGDGAGAVVLETGSKPPGFLSFVLGSNGARPELLNLPGLCGNPNNTNSGSHYLSMNGSEIYKFAVRTMTNASKQVISDAGLTINDIKLLVPHQANKRIIQAVAKKLGVQDDKVFMNVEKYGNTSAASVPIALCEAAEEGGLDANDYIVFVGFGAGLSWGATVLQWGIC